MSIDNIPEKVIKVAIASYGQEVVDNGLLRWESIGPDWIIWKYQKPEIYDGREIYPAGGSVVVIPKQGGNPFGVSQPGTEVTGVPYEYEIVIKDCPAKVSEVAELISDGSEIPIDKVEIFGKIKDENSDSVGVFRLHSPLSLFRNLSAIGVEVALYRIENRGGYW